MQGSYTRFEGVEPGCGVRTISGNACGGLKMDVTFCGRVLGFVDQGSGRAGLRASFSYSKHGKV